MAGVRRGEKPKGPLIAKLIAQDMTNDQIIETLEKQGIYVTRKYIEHVRWSLAKYGTWNGKPPVTGAKDDAPPRMSRAQVERVHELHDQGFDNATISQRVGVHLKTVQRCLHDRKQENKSKDSVNEQIADMVRRGCTYAQIKDELHVNADRIVQVKRHMKQRGETLPEKRSGRKPKEMQDVEDEIESLAQMLTWAGAFRKLAEYCRRRGYDDAVGVAQALADAKEMRL